MGMPREAGQQSRNICVILCNGESTKEAEITTDRVGGRGGEGERKVREAGNSIACEQAPTPPPQRQLARSLEVQISLTFYFK